MSSLQAPSVNGVGWQEAPQQYASLMIPLLHSKHPATHRALVPPPFFSLLAALCAFYLSMLAISIQPQLQYQPVTWAGFVAVKRLLWLHELVWVFCMNTTGALCTGRQQPCSLQLR